MQSIYSTVRPSQVIPRYIIIIHYKYITGVFRKHLHVYMHAVALDVHR